MNFEFLASLVPNFINHFEKNKHRLPFKEDEFKEATLNQEKLNKKKLFLKFCQILSTTNFPVEKIPREIVKIIFNYSLIQIFEGDDAYSSNLLLFPFSLSEKNFNELSEKERNENFHRETRCEIVSRFDKQLKNYIAFSAGDNCFGRQLDYEDKTKIEIYSNQTKDKREQNISIEKKIKSDGKEGFNITISFYQIY